MALCRAMRVPLWSGDSSGRDGNRTRTGVTPRGILSPLRLPIPPLGQASQFPSPARADCSYPPRQANSGKPFVATIVSRASGEGHCRGDALVNRVPRDALSTTPPVLGRPGDGRPSAARPARSLERGNSRSATRWHTCPASPPLVLPASSARIRRQRIDGHQHPAGAKRSARPLVWTAFSARALRSCSTSSSWRWRSCCRCWATASGW